MKLTERLGHTLMITEMCIRPITRFRNFKIQLQTIDLSTRPRGINPTNIVFYSPEHRAEVYSLQLNFKITKLAHLLESKTYLTFFVKVFILCSTFLSVNLQIFNATQAFEGIIMHGLQLIAREIPNKRNQNSQAVNQL